MRAVHSSSTDRKRRTGRSAADPLVSPAISPPSAPGLRLSSSASRLPLPATGLVGRQAEFNVLKRRLIEEACRLVTVVGPGGMGKTRLALHAAQAFDGEFGEGAYFVSLVSISHPAELPAAIATALNVALPAGNSVGEQLDGLLRDKALLLVLDNFEHLLVPAGEEAVALIDHIVRHMTAVRLLVTSRERLRSPSEHILELTGLATPSLAAPDELKEIATSDAVALFVQRARQVAPAFALTAANTVAVARLCTLLGGMPLGIELAASWIRTLTPADILAELAQNLDILSLTDRTAPSRHRSLRAVFEHSWNLLAPDEQRVAARLSVFRDGFQREAALAVAGAGLSQLAALIDKSLIYTVTESAGAVSSLLRYGMHELLRQFLLQQARLHDDDRAISRRHAEYFTALAEQVDTHLYEDESPAWLGRLESEQGNLRAALEWCLTQDQAPAIGLRLAGALGRYWYLTVAWAEGRGWLQLALAHAPSGVDGDKRARALTKLGELCHVLSDYAAATRYLDEALACWRAQQDELETAWTLFQIGTLASTLGDPTRSVTYLEESLALYRRLDAPWHVAIVLMQLGSVVLNHEGAGRAVGLLDEAVPIFRRLQHDGGMGVSLNLLGWARLEQQDPAGARLHFQEALVTSQRHASQPVVAWSLRNLALAQLKERAFDAARRDLRACLRIYRQIGSRSGATIAFEILAALEADTAQPAAAVRWMGAAEQMRQMTGEPRAAFDEALYYRQARATTQAALDSDAWQAAWRAGAALTWEAAMDLADATSSAVAVTRTV